MVEDFSETKFDYPPEQEAYYTAMYGRVPDVVIDTSLECVLSWGRPWWHIKKIINSRNCRKHSLTYADHLRCWEALLYTLAERLVKFSLPKRMRGTTCSMQWRRDMYDDAKSYLWILIMRSGGKNIKPDWLAQIAITRAARASGVQKVPSDFNMPIFKDMHVRPIDNPAHIVADNHERQKLSRRLVNAVNRRIAWRVPEGLHPGVGALIAKIKAGKIGGRKNYWLVNLMRIHEKLAARNIMRYKNIPNDALREKGDLLYLALIDIDETSVLPELYSVVGEAGMKAILEVFGGAVMHVPTMQKVAEATKSASLWADYCKGDVPLDKLADSHKVPMKEAMRIINRWNELQKAGQNVGKPD